MLASAIGCDPDQILDWPVSKFKLWYQINTLTDSHRDLNLGIISAVATHQASLLEEIFPQRSLFATSEVSRPAKEVLEEIDSKLSRTNFQSVSIEDI